MTVFEWPATEKHPFCIVKVQSGRTTFASCSLSEIKKDLPEVVLKQVRNMSLINMCLEDHFPNETSCITFSQGFGLIPDHRSEIMHCKGRSCRMVVSNSKWRLGYSFRCYNKKSHSKEKCLKDISPFENTFFEGSHLTMLDIFKVVMCFVSKLTVKQVVEQLGIGTETIIDWYSFCREVCEIVLANEFQERIGGKGMMVEVNESHFFRRDSGWGRKRKWEDSLLIGCYCRETRHCRIVRIKDEQHGSIMPLLLQIIDNSSTIVTDLEKVYEGCERYGFCARKSVDHARYFVCPVDSQIRTYNLKPTLQWRKGRMVSCGDEGCEDKYLAEREYRCRYFRNMDMAPLPLDDRFLLFLYHVTLVYPGPGKECLTFPLLEVRNDDNNSGNGELVSEEGIDLLDNLCEYEMEPPLKK